MSAKITLQAADGHRLSAYVAGPESATKGLVVVQEIFGVNPHIRRMADDFAAQGYRVVCPALFDRVSPGGEFGVELGYDQTGFETGFAMKGRVGEEAALADVEAAAQYVSEPGRPVGIIGYCWGGLVAWLGATRSARFQAAVCWYGAGIADDCQKPTRCPVQMHFGELDHYIPASAVEAIGRAQPGVEIFTYPQADHGFGCADRASFNRPAYDQARQHSLEFLARHL